MGVDCSIILRDDNVRKSKTYKERIDRLRFIEENLIKKYGIANREDAIIEDFDDDRGPRFIFEPYGIVSINMYDGFWEIETSWRYNAYFNDEGGPSGYQLTCYKIAQDFGCEDAYICSEYYAWNSDYLDDHTFEEWLSEIRSCFGEIREIEPNTKYSIDEKVCPGVFHDSFSGLKEKKEELSGMVENLGYSLHGLFPSYLKFITVSRGTDVFLMSRETLELLLPEPITLFRDLNYSSFEAVSGGKTYLFAIDGQVLHIAERGLFVWEWATKYKNFDEYHSVRVFNPETGQEVFVVNSIEPSNEPNHYFAFKTYYDRNRNAIIPKMRL